MATDTTAAVERRPFWRRRWIAVLLVTLLSALIHFWVAWQLPLDADEPVYLNAASYYARSLSEGDIQRVIDYPGNREHPALVKLVYSIPYLLLSPEYGSLRELFFNRLISGLFGTLSVLLVAMVDPLAGLLLALHSLTIKYTSEVYLEALPMFFSIAAVLAYERVQGGGRRRWLWISALALGAAAAGKYTYLIILLPLLVLTLTGRKIRPPHLLGYAALALLAFWALNPSLWNDPFNRLVDSLFYHSSYTQGIDVARAGYPWYQPVLWLSRSVPWHPQVFFFPTLDFFIFWLGIAGLSLELPRRPWLAAWVLGGLAVLLAWPTKWPQYTLILTAGLCLSAATVLRVGYGWARQKEDYWNYLETMLPRPGKIFWAGTLLFLGVLMFGRVGYEIDMAQNRRGWSTLDSELTPLPGESIPSLARLADGRMALGTNGGAAVWSPSEASPWGEAATFTPANSGLAGAPVLAVAQDAAGGLWFGTPRGVSRIAQGAWQNFGPAELGLSDAHTLALAADDAGGVWAGTLSGAAHWNGQVWQELTAQTSSGKLPEGAVFSIAVQAGQGGPVVWFGTYAGVTRWDIAADEWHSDDFGELALGWAGVADLLIDTRGDVWAATLGAGLARWDGVTWHFYRTSNSGLPYNTVRQVLEIEPGILWVGCGLPTEPGGVLVRFDQNTDEWTEFTSRNSGFSDREPLALALDDAGRLWIGLATGGLQLYEAAD